MSKLAVILTDFDPLGCEHEKRGPRATARKKALPAMKAEADVFIAKAAWTGDDLKGDFVVQAKRNNIGWQKEALINRVVKELPPEYDRVAWVDADIMFRPGWAEKTMDALDKHVIAQMFSKIKIDGDGGKEPTRLKSGAVCRLKRSGGWDINRSCPGFAWSARREFFDNAELYPYFPVSANDTFFCDALLGSGALQGMASRETRDHWDKWRKRQSFPSPDDIGYIDQDITHAFHGRQASRKHKPSREALAGMRYDPASESAIGDNGLVEWSPRIISFCHAYYTERSMTQYWRRRRNYSYYREAVKLAKQLTSPGDDVIDVGGGVLWGTRYLWQMLDRNVVSVEIPENFTSWRRIRGVETFAEDFMTWTPERPYKLAMCLQCIEHVDDPAKFFDKLIATAETVMLSFPYKWSPRVHERNHSGLDESSLAKWTRGRKPSMTRIVTDEGHSRMIAIFNRNPDRIPPGRARA